MKIFPRYARLPVRTPVAIVGLFILMMVLWLQGGITSLYEHLFLLIGSYLTWGVMLPWLQGLAEEMRWKKLPSLIWGLWVIAMLLVIHFLVSNVIYYTLQYLFEEEFHLPQWAEIKTFLMPSILGRLVDFVMFFGLLSWINQTQSLATKKVELAAIETQLQRSRLENLKSQLNPHFLFNTLHSATSMIGTDNEKARETIINLSTLLRKSLQVNQKATHTLREELALTTEYLELEQERFQDRLTISQHIEESCLGVSLPTLSLQPIIENAFKHGVAVVEGPAFVGITVRNTGQALTILVENSTDRDSTPLIPSTGIGLKNLRERLTLHYGESFTLVYGPRYGAHDAFEVILTLPLS